MFSRSQASVEHCFSVNDRLKRSISNSSLLKLKEWYVMCEWITEEVDILNVRLTKELCVSLSPLQDKSINKI